MAKHKYKYGAGIRTYSLTAWMNIAAQILNHI